MLHPEMRIDGGEADLVPVRWFEVADAGTMAVAQQQDRRWLVLDAGGVPAHTLAVSRNVTLLEARREHVWGLEADADGVQSVVRFRLGSGGQRSAPIGQPGERSTPR
ncbi:MAG TPA: hypothetical protein VMM18_15830 [Gemmatimonadaceae bacterium]|nr:hypothetical protein [Gemmatimonadaceae bacterium]